MDSTIGSLITAADEGNASAASDLFVKLYAELRAMAQRQLAGRGRGAPLGVNSLLHEAYFALEGMEQARFPDQSRFMAYAARVMRTLIIDHARTRNAQKRGGMFEFTTLEPERVGAGMLADQLELEPLGHALDELATLEPELAQVVDLKFFCGFSFVEIAAMLDVSERTIQRRWDKARLLLHQTLDVAARDA